MGALRGRVPALGLVLALLCALTFAASTPASAAPPAYVGSAGHFGKKVVTIAVDQHVPSQRMDQPVAVQPHPPQALGPGAVAGTAVRAVEREAPAPATRHPRGPPAGR